MSNCEQIVQVAHDKRAPVSNLLRLLMIKEQLSKLLVFLSKSLIVLILTKTSNLVKKFNKILFNFCVSLKNMSNSLIPSFLKSDVSESLRSLTTKERLWANGSGRSPKMSKCANRLFFWANCSLAHHLLIFEQKTSNLFRKLLSKFPTLQWILFLLNVFDYINAYAFKMNKSLKWKYSEAQQLPAIVHSSLRDF